MKDALQWTRKSSFYPVKSGFLRIVVIAMLLPMESMAAMPFQPAPVVPQALQAWVPWVMHDHQNLECTAQGNKRICIWPGQLTVALQPTGARFSLQVHLDRPGWLRLPGSQKHWPQAVKDGEIAAFVGKDGKGNPRVQLMAGQHKISGQWLWKTAPEVLTVPRELGLTRVIAADGSGAASGAASGVSKMRREGERLWLRQGSGPRDTVRDSLRARVQRRVDDGVPLRVTTRILLQVAGQARDVDLGQILLQGSVPTAVQGGGLPVQVTAAGRVRVHVRPGRHQLEISAVVPADRTALNVPKHKTDVGLEAAETWVFFTAVQVRTVEVSGGTAVDPERTRLGDDWRGGSSFLLEQGQALKLRTTRRGQAVPPPNRLKVQRRIWLDHGGLTIEDRITGQMHRDWRLDYAGAGRLGRVTDRKGKRDLLITRRPQNLGDTTRKNPGKSGQKLNSAHEDTGAAGVELRHGKIDLLAVSRMDTVPAQLKAIGWHADVQTLNATLHLPPGWTLLSATGVDHVPHTWLADWTLFDFFLVLMVALGTARLIGWPWGVVALVALGLCHGESGAPEWVWLSLLGSLALVRALPAGWFRRAAQLWRGLAMISLVLILVPFSVLQVRHGVYPQVAQPRHGGSWTNLNMSGMGGMDQEDKSTAARAEATPLVDIALRKGRGSASRTRPGKRSAYKTVDIRSLSRQLSQVDPKAVVQTGPGLPDWSWSRWPLRWSGPVAQDHTLALVLLSPRMNLLLALLRVALLIALGLALLEVKKLRAGGRRWLGEAAASTVALLLTSAALLIVLAPTQARATTPSAKTPAIAAAPATSAPATSAPASAQAAGGQGSALVPPQWALQTLKKRLLAANACPPGGCIVTPSATLQIDGRVVTYSAEVHAIRATAWTLPGGLDVAQVRIDGQVTWQLRRGEGLQVRVPAGSHRLTIAGSLPPGRVVSLRFVDSSRPASLKLIAPGWRVDGLGAGDGAGGGGGPEGSLQLTRIRKTALKAQKNGLKVARPGVDKPSVDKPGADDDAAAAEALQTELPAWYSVERELLLGLPWKVVTTVRRVRSGRAALVRLPLLPGEAVISAHVRVERAKAGNTKAGSATASSTALREAIVQLPRGVQELRFESELPTASRLVLRAPTDRPWTEAWHLRCSAIWRCTTTGLAPTSRRSADGALALQWRPWPGEAVTVQIQRPVGSAGQTTTIVRVDYTVKPGSRLLEGTLKLRLRASQGGTRKLTIPADAELQSVLIDGKQRGLRAEPIAAGEDSLAGKVVQVPIHPGEQRVELRWQQPWQHGLREQVPAVDVGGPAANVRVKIVTADSRWLLWAFGPRWGPAVLFWSHLAILLLLAIGLGKMRFLPVNTGQWLLLSLGFAQLPALALLPVVFFFLVFFWRKTFWRSRPAPQLATAFSLGQLALIGVALLFLGSLYAAVHSNLLMDLDMQVQGMGSSNAKLIWYVDRVDHALPTPGIWSLPVLVWRVAMLLWSLWLVRALITWLQWAWACFGDGGLWRKNPPRVIGRGAGRYGYRDGDGDGDIPPPPSGGADLG